MEDTLVSFIMPIYNAELFIEDAIKSVLNQTYTNFELLLINDFSTDKTMDIVNRFGDERIRILHNNCNRGIAYSRNRGIDESKGKYIAIMDDDDITLNYRLKMQVDFLNNNTNIDIVGGKYQLIDINGNLIRESNIAYNNPMYIKALFLFQNIYSNGEMMFRKDLICKNNIRYSENQFGMEDFKFWIDCSKVGKFYTIDEVFLKHRIHDKSETYKTCTTKAKQRERHLMELQKYSMNKSNIKVSQEDLKIINHYSNNAKCMNKSELYKYYLSLKKIISNASDIQLDCLKELKILCSKYLLNQIKYIEDLWN